MFLLMRLPVKGVRIITEAKYEEVTDKGLVITTKDGKRELLEADNVLPALPLKPDTEIIKKLGDDVAEVYTIGSSNEPGLTEHAIKDVARIARII